MSSYNTYDVCRTKCLCFNCKNRTSCRKSCCSSCIGIPEEDIERGPDCYESGYFAECENYESFPED